VQSEHEWTLITTTFGVELKTVKYSKVTQKRTSYDTKYHPCKTLCF